MSCRAVLAAAAVVLTPVSAFADAADSYGVDSRAAAMGGAGTALVTGGGGAYYNPASIVVSGRTLSVGFLGARTFFPSTGRVVVGYDSSEQPVIIDLNNQTPDVAGFFFRSSVPLGKRFGLGLMLYHPAQRVMRIQSQDPFMPTYALYDNRQQRLTLNVGFASRIAGGVTLGIGTSILSTNEMQQGLNVPAGAEQSDRSNGYVRLDIVPRATPTAGVRVELGDFVVGATYRGELKLPGDIEFQNSADVVLESGPSLRFRTHSNIAGTIPLVEHFTPMQVALGAAWDHPRQPWAATIDVTWMRWSNYHGPYLDLALDPLQLPPLGEVPVQWRAAPPDDFRDTIVPRVGAEWRTTGKFRWALRAGYGYEMSPIPTQIAETNLLDSDKHVLTTGAGVAFTLYDVPLALDAHVQMHLLETRTAVKAVQYDCSNPDERPPVGTICGGSLTSSGSILSGGLTLQVRY